MFLIFNAFFKGFTPFSGWMAGPVVFGIVVDSACQIWSASCSGQGACALYDNNDLRIKYHSYQVISKVIAVLLQVLVLINARRKTDWSLKHEDEGSEDLDAGEAMLEQEMDSYDPSSWKAQPIYKGGTKNGTA